MSENTTCDVGDVDDVAFKHRIFNLVDEKRFTELQYYLPNLPDPFRNEIGDTILHRICRKSCGGTDYRVYYPFLNLILSEYPHYITISNFDGETPLNVACKKAECMELISHLVDLDPSIVNLPDKNGYIPLQSLICCIAPSVSFRSSAATKMQICQVVELLIKKGSNVNYENDYRNALMCALFENQFHSGEILNTIAMQLIENGANIFSSNGVYHVFKQIRYFSYENIEKILELHKSKINQIDSYKYTPLHWLLLEPRNSKIIDIIKLMFSHGAQIESETDIISLAQEENCDFNTINLLLEHCPGYNVNKQDSEGKTLIVKFGVQSSIVQRLLNLGADPSIADKYGENALSTLTRSVKGDVDTIMLLIKHGASPVLNSTTNVITLTNYISMKPNWIRLLAYILDVTPILKETPLQENVIIFVTTLIKSLTIYYFETNEKSFRNDVIHESLKMIIENNSSVLNLEFNLHNTIQNKRTPILEPFGHVLSVYSGYAHQFLHTAPTFQLLNTFLNIMFELGFTVDHVPSHVVTPLTMLMFIIKQDDRHNTEPNFLKLYNLFINKGCYVNSRVLDNHEEYIQMKFHVRNYQLKIDNKISDVLFLAVVKEDLDIVKSLLSNWWGPPLGLVPFFPTQQGYIQVYGKLFTIWLPVLLTYGGVPHGSSLEVQLRTCMKRNKLVVQKAYNPSINYRGIWKRYREVMNTPLTLQNLCKYSIRKCLADRASMPGASLPALIQELPLPTYICDLITH